MWQPQEILNVFNTFTLKKTYFYFEKCKDFLKKLEHGFLVEDNKIEKVIFSYKSAQKGILKQIEWRVQHGPITNNGVSPVTALFFSKILFQFKNPV